jgi:hypothetical protein
MIRGTHTGNDFRSARKFGVACAVLALLVGSVGCNQDEAWAAFRSAAGSGLETGLRGFLGGVTDGLFAIYDLGTDAAAADSTTTDTTTGAGG